jgi:hypothetical protein
MTTSATTDPAPFPREAPPVLHEERRHPSDLVRVRMTFGGACGRGLSDGSVAFHGDEVTLPREVAEGMTRGDSPIAVVIGFVPAPPPPSDPEPPVLLLDKLRAAFSDDPSLTAAPRSDSDLVKIRLTLDGRPGGVTAADGEVYFDGDVCLVTQEYARAYPRAKYAPFTILGYVPAPPPPPVEGPALTVRFARTSGTYSEHLGRVPKPGEVIALPVAEARAYIDAGEATLDPASARCTLTTALLALASVPTPDGATQVIAALDDVLRAAGLPIPLEAPADVPR